jgi:hypothetical protein
MPFKSEAQRRWMYAKHPAMAKRWEAHTHDKSLPERATRGLKRASDQRTKKNLYSRA